MGSIFLYIVYGKLEKKRRKFLLIRYFFKKKLEFVLQIQDKVLYLHQQTRTTDLFTFNFTTMETLNITLNESLKVKEYRLMYLWGAWVTKVKIYAESVEEAIFDANELMEGCNPVLSTALFCGNKLIKTYYTNPKQSIGI